MACFSSAPGDSTLLIASLSREGPELDWDALSDPSIVSYLSEILSNDVIDDETDPEAFESALTGMVEG